MLKRIIDYFKKKTVGQLKDDVTFWRTVRSLSSNETSVTNPYEVSAWVYSAVNAIARNISRVPIKLYEEAKSNDNKPLTDFDVIPITSGDLYNVIMNPNFLTTGKQFIYGTVLSLENYGECFWILDRDDITKIPSEMWLAHPKRFEPILSTDKKQLLGWKYKFNSEEIELKHHEVLFFRFLNPSGDLRGISAMSAAQLGIDQDHFASRFNKTFFEEGVAISGVIEVPDELTNEAYNRLITAFEERHKGHKKAHRVALLEGGGTFKPYTPSYKDFEFTSLRKINKEEILAAFGVNPVIVGDYTNIKCYHPDTNILTNTGFKPIADISTQDLVASLDFTTNNIVYAYVKKTYAYHYDGIMYESDFFSVTSNHNMLVEKNSHISFEKIEKVVENLDEYTFLAKQPFKIDKVEQVQYSGDVYCIEVPPFHNVLTRYKENLLWNGNSYEGIRASHRAFWIETLVPKLEYISDTINFQFLSKIGNGKSRFKFDLNAVEALREDFYRKVDAAERLYQIGFPVNMINKRLDLGMDDIIWGDSWWIDAGRIPAGTQPTEEKPVEEEKYLHPLSKKFETKLRKYLFEQRKSVLSSVSASFTNYKQAASVINLDNNKLEKYLYPIYQEIGVLAQLDDIETFIASKTKRFSLILNNNIKKNIMNILKSDRENDKEVLEKIRKFYNFTSSKSLDIANAELTSLQVKNIIPKRRNL